MSYLVDNSEREHEACRLLVQMPPLSERIFQSVGIHPSFSWFILRMDMNRLVASMHGDVDILAGPLNWADAQKFDAYVSQEQADHAEWHISLNYDLAARRLARDGGIQWPPPLKHLIGVEAKCANLPRSATQISVDTLKATKSQSSQVRKIRLGVEKMLDIGINHALLLDIIANPPVSGPNGGAWITSINLASSSKEAMSSILGQRLPEECEAAHWVWSIGSVDGGDEFHRGAATFVQLRPSKGNSCLELVATREEMEPRLTAILSRFDAPTVFPAVFLDCQTCRSIHPISWNGSGCIHS